MIPLQDDNPTELTPVVTVTFILICVLVFLYQASLSPPHAEAIVFQYGAIPALLFGQADLPPSIAIGIPAYATLLTSMFMHGGLYLACGILAALSHAVTDPTSTIPMVGASGAISGVLGAYILLFPRAHVLVFMPGVGMMRVAAGVVLGLWFVMQLLSGGMSIGGPGGGVAFFAHIGGFVAGMALIGFFKRPDVPFFSPPRSGRWDL